MSGKLLDFLESSLDPLLLLLFSVFSSRNLDRQIRSGCCCCLPKLYHVISLPGESRPKGREFGGSAPLFSSEIINEFSIDQSSKKTNKIVLLICYLSCWVATYFCIQVFAVVQSIKPRHLEAIQIKRDTFLDFYDPLHHVSCSYITHCPKPHAKIACHNKPSFISLSLINSKCWLVVRKLIRFRAFILWQKYCKAHITSLYNVIMEIVQSVSQI